MPTLPSAWIEAALVAGLSAGGAERIELVEDRAADLAPKLDRGRIDAIVGALPVGQMDEALFSEPYAVAMSVRHPLAGAATVTAEQLARETMLVRRHCEALADVSRFFTARGVRPFMAARTISDERAMG